jgi:soluble lytic murein transglycosylase
LKRADDPLAPELAWEGARAMQRLGRNADASERFRSLAERWPSHARAVEALWQLAWLQADSGAAAEAEAAFAALAARHPDHRDADEAAFRAGYVAWLAGRNADASRHWTQIADTKTGEARARALYWLGRQDHDRGDASSAETRWIQAAASDPIGYYGSRAGARAGMDAARVGARDAPPSSASSTAADLANISAQERNALDAELTRWLAGWRSTPADMEASRRAIAESNESLRAQAWLELDERDAAARALRGAIGDYSRDPAGLIAIAERAASLNLPDVSIAAAASVLFAAPPDQRLAAPAVLSRMAYPSAHLDALQRATRERSISAHLMLGLVRQESRFSPTARSPVGALGLTQVMPATGRQIAGWLNEPGFETSDLTQPEVALRYGAAYLGVQLERFDGREWPALAAYNGGPGNADRWFDESGDDQDRFVETIDFRETRRYVQLALAHAAQYARLYPELAR